MIEPAVRNNSALKKACVTRWKTPAMYAPTPTARNMKPSCEMVEYARMRLRSVCTMAMVAAIKPVSAPIQAMACHGGGSQFQQRVRAGQHVDARCHHRRRMDEGRDGARGLPWRPATTQRGVSGLICRWLPARAAALRRSGRRWQPVKRPLRRERHRRRPGLPAVFPKR